MDTSIAGTFFSSKIDLKKNTDNFFYVELPLKVLPEGDFYIRLVFSHCEKDGSWTDYASVEQADLFTVKQCKENYLGMNWEEGWRNNYGSVNLQKVDF